MSRRRMEKRLIELKFRHFTESVRFTIARIVQKHKCKDTSDKMIDILWRACRDDLQGMLRSHTTSDRTGGVEASNEGEQKPKREIIRAYLDQALEYEAELAALENDVFESTYREIVKPIAQDIKGRRVKRSEENDRWDFFNEVEAEPDFERWRSKPLSPAEAVALSLGKEPDVVTPERLDETKTVSGSLFREKFKDRLETINSEILAGKLPIRLSLNDFAEWASDRGWELSPELTRSKSQALSEEILHLKAENDEAQACLKKLRLTVDDLNARSVSSLYKMILGMAFEKYDHTTVGNTPATSKICSDLSLSGLTLDPETILGHLKDAARYLNVTRPKRASR